MRATRLTEEMGYSVQFANARPFQQDGVRVMLCSTSDAEKNSKT